MNLRVMVLSGLLVFSFGCAGMSAEERKGFERLSRQVEELKNSADESSSRLEELNSKLLLLNEKLEGPRAPGEAAVEDLKPPEGLTVVPLGEDAGRDEKGKAQRAEKADKAVEGAGAGSGKGRADTPEALYGRGQDLYISGSFAGAREAFLELQKRFPDHELADNALYWAGEAYYSEQDYEKALGAFKEVVDRYPGSNKAPDALLKVGFSYAEIKDIGKAREALALLVKKYPKTEPAAKAKKTLEKLSGAKKEGL